MFRYYFLISLLIYGAFFRVGFYMGKQVGKTDAIIEREKDFQQNKTCREFNIPYPGKYEACFNKRKCLISIKE